MLTQLKKGQVQVIIDDDVEVVENAVEALKILREALSDYIFVQVTVAE